jgi:hypothetical protein
MATAHIGQDRLIPLVQNFSTGRASSFHGDSRADISVAVIHDRARRSPSAITAFSALLDYRSPRLLSSNARAAFSGVTKFGPVNTVSCEGMMPYLI